MTLIAIHLLQNHAPSNLNRDDNGDPKDCLFGGVRRARISSQSIKRSIRRSEHFIGYFSDDELSGNRSKIATHIGKYLENSHWKEELSQDEVQIILRQATKLAKAKKEDDSAGEADIASDQPSSAEDTSKADESNENASKDVAAKTDSQEDSSKAQLVFLTRKEVEAVAERLIEMRDQSFPRKTKVKGKTVDTAIAFQDLDADELRQNIGEYEPHSVDIAMFGRMTTSSPFKDVEAAVQVAHAISTHEIEEEFDFFTAVDDLAKSKGAGLLGETAFNSATYYKYLNVHWESLVANLAGDTALARRAVEALIKAAMIAIPSGKQNGFAANNLPDVALIEVQAKNVPLSYANAFVKPVRRSAQQSLLEASVAALQDYLPRINSMYGLEPNRAFVSTVPFQLAEAESCDSLDELLAWLPLES